MTLLGVFSSLPSFAQSERTVHFYITVDWEGVDFKSGILDDADLKRVRAFRQKFPNYPMLHYMNAAYYTNGELSEDEVTKRIKSTLIEQDEIGLHLHPWENLTDAAGVDFIEGPTYFDKELSPYEGKGSPLYPKGHRGGDIPLWSYPKEDIRKLVRFSVDKLKAHGFDNITGFRAGGWQTDEKVLEVLAEEGFKTESSPVSAKKVSNLYPGTTLADNVSKLWAGTHNLSTPYLHEKVDLLMMPNNAGLADYVDADEFVEVLKQNLEGHSGDIHLVYGFHFETAVEYMDRLDESIERMEALSKEMGFKINPATYHMTSSKLRSSLRPKGSCKDLIGGLL